MRGTILNSEFDDGTQEDTEYSLSTGVDYNVFTNLNAFANYRYRRQDSNIDNSEFVENRLSVGARMSF